MSYQLGYNPEGLQPLIIIKDIQGNERYRYESPHVAPPNKTPVKNFSLVSWSIHTGINTDHGYCILGIDDRDNNLLDTTKKRRPIKIKNGWEVEVSLGKSHDTLEKWFTGIIEQPELNRPGTNLQSITITAFGWGIRTAHRIGIIQRFQKKLDDGINLDNTDTQANISEIFKDIVQDKDVLAYEGLGLESEITTNGVKTIEIKMPDFQRQYQTLGLMLNELAQISGAIYGMNPDKDLFLKLRGTDFSGFLITNNIQNPSHITANWDQSKILFSKNQPFNYKESTIDSGYTIAHGLGAQHDTLNHEDTASNAVINLSAKHYAFPFDPLKDNISKLVPFLSKVGIINNRKALVVKIVGGHKIRPNQEDIEPNQEDIRQTVTIPGDRLERELTSATYFEIPFNKDIVRVTHGEKLFMLIVQYDDAANYIKIDYNTRLGHYFLSENGTTWSRRRGAVKFRSFHSKTIHVIGQNVVAKKKLRSKETVFSLQDFPNENSALQAFEGMLDVLSKIRRIYDPIITATPMSRPPIGSTVKLVDVFNGLDTDVEIIGFDISGSAFDADSNLGASTMTLLVEEWFT